MGPGDPQPDYEQHADSPYLYVGFKDSRGTHHITVHHPGVTPDYPIEEIVDDAIDRDSP